MAAICIDIDNVVARTDEVLREVIRRHSRDGVDLAYDDVVCFEYWKCRDAKGQRLDKSEWTEIHTQFTLNHLRRIRPFDGVQDCLTRIGQRFDVHLVTARLSEGRDETWTWLDNHGIPYTEIHYVAHGEKHLIDRSFAAAIEDDREQAYAFASHGVRAFLLAHPWNEVGRFSTVRRMSDWCVLTEEIMGLNV